MVISSFISSILILALGIWASFKLESTMNSFAERQLVIEPNKFSYKMWKDMPVVMYQTFTFFNLTNWNQVKSFGQKPRFVEVGPYVYRTIWTKSDVNFLEDERLVNFAERKQWIFMPKLSKGSEDDLIWTINTPLMTALALIQNAPAVTRNMVSVILDGLGEGAFVKRNIKSLLFEGYSDLIVSIGPLFDRRFSNFNGKFAYLYNKNDSIDGIWTVATGSDDAASLNKIMKFQNGVYNITSLPHVQPPQGLNEVRADCASAWSLDKSTNGQLFPSFDPSDIPPSHSTPPEVIRDEGKFLFYPDLCRPIHLVQSEQQVTAVNGIKATRFKIDPKMFMNSTMAPENRCFEMNPKAPISNAIAATINSVTSAANGTRFSMPNLVASGSSPFAIFSPPSSNTNNGGGLFERSNTVFKGGLLNPPPGNNHQDGQQGPLGRLSRVRQLFNNIVSQRMSSVTNPGSFLPNLTPTNLLLGNHFGSSSNARNAPEDGIVAAPQSNPPPTRIMSSALERLQANLPQSGGPTGAADRWVTQFRFKWPKGVFSIGQCQLGAPIYASLPHFLDADEYYLEQVDGLKPNRSLHEFYFDVESTLHSIPVGAKARLQLNVATPELRFRNVPNAMIPVLWQEVTFDIDKPIAKMLYLSFTMSATFYKWISVFLIALGCFMLTTSFVGSICRQQRKRRHNLSRVSDMRHSGNSQEAPSESPSGHSRHSSQSRSSSKRSISDVSGSDTARAQCDGADLCAGTINHGFSLELQHSSTPLAQSSQSKMSSLSPKGSSNSSRASSHCELVPESVAEPDGSLTTGVGVPQCANCLLACIRQSSPRNTNV